MHPGSTGHQVYNYPRVISLINREQYDRLSSRRPPSIAQTHLEATLTATTNRQYWAACPQGQKDFRTTCGTAMSVVRAGRGRPAGHTAGQLCHGSRFASQLTAVNQIWPQTLTPNEENKQKNTNGITKTAAEGERFTLVELFGIHHSPPSLRRPIIEAISLKRTN